MSRHAEALEIAGIGFWELDLRTEELVWSDRVYEIFELVPATHEASYQGFLDAVHPADREAVDAVYRASVENRTSYEKEHRLLMADGRVKHVLERGKTYYDANGEPLRSVGTVQDITERKRAEEALRGNEQRFRALTALSPVGIFLDDAEGKAIYINERCARLIGVPREEALGFDWAPLIHPEDRERVVQEWKIAVRNRTRFRQEYRWVHPDGKIVWTLGEVLPVEGATDEVSFVGTLTETTEQRRIADELSEQHARNERILQSSMDGFILADVSGQILDVNPAYCRLVGWSARELRGMNIAQLEARLSQEEIDERIGQMLRNGSARFETRHRRRNGVAVDLEVSTFAMAPEGGPPLVSAFVRDIGERKRAETMVRASEQRFRSLFEGVPVALWEEDFSEVVAYLEELGFREMGDFRSFLVDRPDVVAECASRVRVLGVNRAGLELHGAESLEELAGDLNRTFTPRSYDVFREELVALRNAESFYETEAEVMTLSGESRQVIIRWSAPTASAGSYSRVFVSLADVTELEAARRELREVNLGLESVIEERTAQLVAVNREMETFAYSVSHDLKAPLRAIDGYSAMLADRRRSATSEETKRLLGEIRSNARQMAHLIDDLLDFSRVGRVTMEVAEVDTRQLVESLLSDLKRLEGDRTVELLVGELPSVVGDLGLLRQVWSNLLENAFKFTFGRKIARIEIECEPEETRWVFTVRDNGAGFDMEYADKLFGVFQRLHYQDEFPGTGVGLATVQRIVRRHGGDVWAEGEVDAGATFSFSLPRAGEAG